MSGKYFSACSDVPAGAHQPFERSWPNGPHLNNVPGLAQKARNFGSTGNNKRF